MHFSLFPLFFSAVSCFLGGFATTTVTQTFRYGVKRDAEPRGGLWKNRFKRGSGALIVLIRPLETLTACECHQVHTEARITIEWCSYRQQRLRHVQRHTHTHTLTHAHSHLLRNRTRRTRGLVYSKLLF